MSSKTTVDPPAIWRRQRPPKKASAKDAGTATPVVDAKKATNTKTTMAKGKIAEEKKEKKPLAKTTKPTAAKKDAPEQPTPVTPATSRILDEVRAKGTLSQTQAVKAEGSSSTSSVSAAATEKATTPPEPQIKQTPPPTTQRTTTIPLPRKPAPAPSPIQPLSHTAVRSSIAAPRQQPQQQQQPAKNPYPSTLRPSQQHPHQYQQRPHPPAYQNTRIIEPTPDIRLPPKYKPAARRVTAIIVGLPIVIVFGWELWARWRGKEVKRKFGEGV